MPNLEFTGSWSLGEAGYAFLLERLTGAGVRTLVEFGSGVSTARLARDLSGLELLYSIESDRNYLRHTSELISPRGAPRVQLELRPLKWQMIGGRIFKSYAPGEMPSSVDAVFVDGPPQATRRGREACLYQVYDRLRVGGFVYLDDARRPTEQRILANWLDTLADLNLVEVGEAGHGIAVLRKTGGRPPRASLAATLDSFAAAAACARDRLLRARR